MPGKDRREVAGRRGPSFSDQLRAALADSPDTLQAIADRAGVPRTALSRFLRRERGLNLDTFERACESLGFRLTGGPARVRGKPRRPTRRPAGDSADDLIKPEDEVSTE